MWFATAKSRYDNIGENFIAFFLLTREGLPILKITTQESLPIDLDLASAAISAIKHASEQTIAHSSQLELLASENAVIVEAGSSLVAALLLKKVEVEDEVKRRFISEKLDSLIDELEKHFEEMDSRADGCEIAEKVTLAKFAEFLLEEPAQTPSPETLLENASSHFFKGISTQVFDSYLKGPTFEGLLKRIKVPTEIVVNIYNSICENCMNFEDIIRKYGEIDRYKLAKLVLFLTKTDLAKLYVDTKRFKVVSSLF